MELATIEMPRTEARKAYLEYRNVIKEAQAKELDEVQRRQRAQDEAIAAGYRTLSVGRQLIRLSEAIIAGGFDTRGYPKLAISRCDIEEVHVQRWPSGTLRYRPWQEGRWGGTWNHDKSRSISKVINIDGPGRQTDNLSIEAIATVPPIPPQYRPDAHPRNYHILFEAEWRKPRTNRRSAGDPALLKHLGGDLYAVLAVWDLTEVEKAALDGGMVLA